jgi:DNA-binding MarR family transcriptional regulator
MSSKEDLAKQVFMAARDQGISSVLFRNAIGRKLGLSITDWECMSLLGINGTSTPTELARYTGLTTGSTTAMLDRLELAGLIVRKPNPKDRRGVLIEINHKSAINKKSKEMVGPIQKAHWELLDSYTENELKIIVDFLTRFTNNVKVHTQIIEKDAR